MTKQLTVKWPYIANAVFRIAQNHGEKNNFRRFSGGAIAPPRALSSVSVTPLTFCVADFVSTIK